MNAAKLLFWWLVAALMLFAAVTAAAPTILHLILAVLGVGAFGFGCEAGAAATSRWEN